MAWTGDMSKQSKKEEAERRRQEEREKAFEAWLSKKREREIVSLRLFCDVQ